jgi:peptide/nickel transport system substrate-binding protein
MIDLKQSSPHSSTDPISRRKFLKQMSALGLSMAMLPSVLHGSAQAAVPQKGGRFRMGMGGAHTTDSLNTSTLADQFEIHTNYALRNNLVEVNHKGEVIPELAESWDVSSDAVKWVFDLRRGVEFHNGKTLDAEDVIYSIRHHMGPDSKSAAKGLVDQIDDIRADGKNRVIFTLKGGNADFPYIMNDYHLTIVPAGTTGNQWEKGIGTGGYTLAEWEPGVRTFLKRNPNYFKQGRAHFDEVEILGINDVNARTNALKTGRIDYMNQAELKTVHLLKRMPGIEIMQIDGGFHFTLPMLTDISPFDQNHARLALKHAIDREAIVKQVLRGYGTVGNDHPIQKNHPFFAADIPQRQYDPDKAKFYLKKAGLTDQTFPLHTSDLNTIYLDMATLFKEHARKAGLKIQLIKEPADGYWSNVWTKKPFCNSHWGARPTADMMFSLAYTSQAKWNETHLKSARLDELVKIARAELNQAKRQEAYTECQQLIRDEGGTIVPCFKDYVEAASTKVQHGPISGLLETDAHRAAERWWFA